MTKLDSITSNSQRERPVSFPSIHTQNIYPRFRLRLCSEFNIEKAPLRT